MKIQKNLIGFWCLFVMIPFLAMGGDHQFKVWQHDSYAPELNLMPFFEFNKSLFPDTTLVDCASAQNVGVKDVKFDEATIYWDTEVGVSWEYVVQLVGGALPTGSGVATLVNEAIISQDFTGNNLTSNTAYEFYVRTNCGTKGFGDWEGPYDFRTICIAFNTPFKESFDTSSENKDCWTILDIANDASGVNNAWAISTSAYLGSGSMRFYGSYGMDHDDWLISPAISLKGGNYAITYYLKTDIYSESKFEVLLSKDGVAVSDFSTVLQPMTVYKLGSFTKKVLYVTDITGDVNIAWHTKGSGNMEIIIDEVSLEAVDCVAPNDEIIISNIKTNEATASWVDKNNKSWEYFVQDAGGAMPIGSGTVVNSNTDKVTKTNGVGSGALKPNTEYEIYVRSNCGPGKYSSWVGPVKFRTPCTSFSAPLWEGFNKDSETMDCWTIVDGNNNANTYDGIWKTTDYSQFEGDGVMYLSGSGSPHNDWLISPTIDLNSTSIYRLKYHYKASSYYDNKFEVLLSDKGIGLPDFAKVLVPSVVYKNEVYVEQKAFITGVTQANIAWHVLTDGYTNVYIDNVFLEEVIGCPEPLGLGVKDIKKDSATLIWTDDFKATSWEYWVQDKGGVVPTGKGSVVSKKEVITTKDHAGKNLTPNTEYEYYIRTVCSDGKTSIWSGPFIFRTICDVVDLPFWEGFNTKSETIYCWDILDINGDGGSYDGKWIRATYGQYEGSNGMSLNVYDYDNNIESDDWLISPSFKFDSKKIYRFKFHYKTSSYYETSNFEVLLSNSGRKPSDFKKVVLEDKYYKTDNYIEHKSFLKDYSGDAILAWHVAGKGTKNILIDNVFVEEVETCPEPLGLGVKNEEKDKVTIFWTDDFKATKWEYFVQLQGVGVPSSKGTATSLKENAISSEYNGTVLKPNTDYEFYVRTDCGDGTYSIWNGPFVFVTTCDVYNVPFWEGFNADTKTIRCWEVIDANGDGDASTGLNTWKLYGYDGFEGGRSMAFSYYGSAENDDWLVSPTMVMNKTTYVLKYHYKSSSYSSSSLEVLYSSKGIGVGDFKTILSPSEVYKNDEWKEKVVFFEGVLGEGNIAWRSDSEGNVNFYIDNVFLKKVENCKEPYYVKVVKQTSTSIDIEWEQEGGNTEWEVLVVNFGDDETGTPVKTMTVTGNPEASIIGLSEGKGYTIYVRAKCSNGSYSNWSTPVNTGTKVGANDECAGAINVPVNNGLDCVKSVSASSIGATFSSAPRPSCFGWGADVDIWFEFTATSNVHQISLNNFTSLDGGYLPSAFIALYDKDCATISSTTAPVTPILCENMNRNGIYKKVLMNLVPGQKYYARIGIVTGNYIFDVCITTSDSGYLEVSPSGEDYSVEELIKDVLINSQCDLISNIRYQAGDGKGTINTLGYFNRGDTDFPFEEGIVLATHAVDYVPGPYRGFEAYKPRIPFWSGDPDLNEVIDQVGGSGFGSNKAVAVLEFDFIPIKDSIKFEYLFVSDSFNRGCAVVCQPGGALFAAWLTEVETGEGQNLALVPGTKDPIAISTIRDNSKSGASCESVNPEFYWKNFDNDQDDPLVAPVNYTGMTVPMSSETVYVKPGKKYHIKLAIADFCGFLADASAVFFNAGSFDLGSIDLGDDLLVETGTALCGNETKVIKSGLEESADFRMEIEWWLDGVIIAGENGPDLEVKESGKYTMKVKFVDLGCESIGEVTVEIFPPISTVVNKAEPLVFCRYSLGRQNLDLSVVEKGMFSKVNKVDYSIGYFDSEANAKSGTSPISTDYELNGSNEAVSIYLRVDDLRTGCSEVFELILIPEKGEEPVKRESVSVCATYEFPVLEDNQVYYTGKGGTGIEYKAGDSMDVPGEHEIYVLQMNGDSGCYEETSYKVSITDAVKADIFDDKVLNCSVHILGELSENNKYYTEPGGKGVELQPGTTVPLTSTIYVYAVSEDGLCVDESSYTIKYEDCPIPKGFSPNDDGLNDRFDLSRHGVQNLKVYNRYGAEVFSYGFGYTDEWKGQDSSGKNLPDGTYYYVVQAHDKIRTGWVQINR